MPRIPDYNPSPRGLNPDEKGFAAYETASRRIAPLYNQAATDIARAGALKADDAAELGKWPFDILDLRMRMAGVEPLGRGRAAGGGGGGVRFRTTGGGRGSYSNDPISDFSNERMPNLAALNGDFSDYAARVGRAAYGIAGYGTPYSGGGAGSQETIGQAQSGNYTLQGGKFVKYNPYSQVDPNQDAIDGATKWYEGTHKDPVTGKPVPNMQTDAQGFFQPVGTGADSTDYTPTGEFSGRLQQESSGETVDTTPSFWDNASSLISDMAGAVGNVLTGQASATDMGNPLE